TFSPPAAVTTCGGGKGSCRRARCVSACWKRWRRRPRGAQSARSSPRTAGSDQPMKILETRVYRGPNLYALWPTIRLRVELGELERFPTLQLPRFTDKLLAVIPRLQEHTCSYGEPGGFVRRMTEDEGT